MLSDPYSFPTDAALALLCDAAPGVPILGGISSGRTPDGQGAVFSGDEVHESGAVGVRLDGIEMLPCVSQGAAPVGREVTITAGEGNVINELAGRPALETVEQIISELSPRERTLVAGGLLIGIVIDGGKPDYQQGDFLVRGVLGADPDSGSLAVSASVRPGTGVEAARPRRTVGRRGPSPRAAAARRGDGRPRRPLERSCSPATVAAARCSASPITTRRRSRRELRGAPAAGFFAAGEIGPVGRPKLPARVHRDASRCSRTDATRPVREASPTLPPVTLLSGNALVTGATGGIGQAIARALAARGATVTVTGRRVEVLEPLAERDLRPRDRVRPVAPRRGRPARPGGGSGRRARRQRGAARSGRAHRPDPGADRRDARGQPARADRARAGARTADDLARARPPGVHLVAERQGSDPRDFDLRRRQVRAAWVRAMPARGPAPARSRRLESCCPASSATRGCSPSTNVELPRGVGTRSPEDVAAAVVKAIEHNRAEVEVAPLGLRLGATFAGVAPELAAAAARRLGSTKVAFDMADAQRGTH